MTGQGTGPLHASCVAFGPERGILIFGPSGSGKSGLALMLMSLGASLVADDRVLVQPQGLSLIASCPPPILGRIEARHVGILRATPLPQARLVLAIDMGTEETDRLPPNRQHALNGIVLPLLNKVGGCHFPAAILHYVHQSSS